MSWDDGFLSALQAPPGPAIYLVRTRQVCREIYASDYVASTHPHYGDPILAGPPETMGTSVSVDSWSATVGGVTFDLAGELASLRGAITRGTCVEVLMGFPGWTEDAFQVIALGRVDNVTFDGRRAQLSILDATSMVDGRWEEDGDKISLFYGLRAGNIASTQLNGAHTAGAATITVDSTAGFTRESGGTGAILLGEQVLTYTGTTGTTFTGVSSVGRCLTTEADGADNDYVYELAYLYGNPVGIALKVLLSTGDGTNGGYDVYSRGWGFGIPESMVDVAEMEVIRDELVVVSSGSYKAEIFQLEEVPDPRAWLTGFLAPFGLVLTQRQGRLSVRAACGLRSRGPSTLLAITDTDIIAGTLRSEWYNPDTPAEYGYSSVAHATVVVSDSAETVETLPAGHDKVIDLSSVLFPEDGYNVGYVQTEVHDRLYLFAKRIGEVLTIELPTLYWSHLAVLDWVTFTSTCTMLRYAYNAGREVMVIGVVPNYRANTTTLRLLYLPEESR